MTQFTATTVMKSNVSKTIAAFLLVSLGAGCGSSTGESPGDGGGSTDGGNSTQDGKSSDGSSVKDGKSTNDGTAIDDGNAADVEEDGDVLEAGNTLAPGGVNLRTAGNYAILTKSGISTVPPSVITGDIGVSPITAAAITGFSLTAASTKVFSTSTQVTGEVFASNYAVPTPANLTTAVADMLTAFTDAAGRAPGVTELGAGNIGGLTLMPGVYKWSSAVTIPTNVTLSGGATDVWIFQIAQSLTMSSATSIVLMGEAVPQNIFWQVTGAVSLGTTSHFEGIILSQTMIALDTGASINGRLLAQTEVSLEKSTVTAP
jgi:hypothetical protein